MKLPFRLIVIAGPTASGKTDLAIRLAQAFRAEVISADSRQIYREMQIGTARPPEEEMQGVPHHFVGTRSIRDYYSAGRYEQDVLDLIRRLSTTTDRAFLVGGSGLYIRAVSHGIDALPGPDPALRGQLITRLEEEGLDPLVRELLLLDPAASDRTDLRNPKRVLRALEIMYQTGLPMPAKARSAPLPRPFTMLKIGLHMDREALYSRINLRADQMIAQGLLEEVRALHPYRSLTALQTVGYTEFFNYLEGKYSFEEAVRLFKRNTRRYAKRQLTWFRKDKEFEWFNPFHFHEIKDHVNQFLNL